MDITPKTKKHMSKNEVALLVDLIQSNPIITTKETNAVTNKLKEECWATLTNTFNSKCGKIPRQRDQLKLKWDNLKKAARKRAANIRVNNLKTRGGKSDYIPLDEILDKVTVIMGSTCSGLNVPFGGDASDNVVSDLEHNVGDETVEEDLDDARVNIPDESFLSPNTTKKRKIDFSPQAVLSGFKYKQGAKYLYGMTSMSKSLQSKAKKLKSYQDGRLQRNLAIAKYYEKRTEKLDLEIQILKMELANEENNHCNINK